MPFISSKADGAQLFYREYSPSTNVPAFKSAERRNEARKPTLVFAAAWPFSSKMYDHIMLPLCESYGYRCIAMDRRGYGDSQWSCSPQPGKEIDYDTFADDLALVLDIVASATDGNGFVGIGASLGCGELLLALHRNSKLQPSCRGLVFLGPSLPIPLQTARKSTGPPRSFWDSLLERLRNDRYDALTNAMPYIFGEQGIKLLSSNEVRRYEDIAMSADPFALERTIQIFLDRDFTYLIEQRPFRFPLLMIHGDADAANPVETGPGLIKANWPNSKVTVYEGAAHGEFSECGFGKREQLTIFSHCCDAQGAVFEGCRCVHSIGVRTATPSSRLPC